VREKKKKKEWNGGNLRKSEKEGNRQIEGCKKIYDENERRGKEIWGQAREWEWREVKSWCANENFVTEFQELLFPPL
jgi:hypothetical protein